MKNSHFQGVSSAPRMAFQIPALCKDFKDLHEPCLPQSPQLKLSSKAKYTIHLAVAPEVLSCEPENGGETKHFTAFASKPRELLAISSLKSYLCLTKNRTKLYVSVMKY